MTTWRSAGDVLVWGCPVRKQLVRGRLAAGTALPKSPPGQPVTLAVSCPCGEEHRVEAVTRRRRPGDCFDVDPVAVRPLPRKRRRR